MFRVECRLLLALSVCLGLFVTGCSTGVQTAQSVATNGSTTSSAQQVLPPATQKNIYVVQGGKEPMSTLVFPLTAKGATAPNLEIPGTGVAVDGSGNIYVLDRKGSQVFDVTAINIYSANAPSAKPIRSLPVGSGTKIAAVIAMTVSKAGEIFVCDGTGIAVFGPTANGNDDPVRYITYANSAVQGGTEKLFANYMAVDTAGNLYATGSHPLMVFGPKDNGAVTPLRTIEGSATLMGPAGCPGGSAIFGLALDETANIYVLSRCELEKQAPTAPFAVYEFSSTANGNVAPIRTITTGLGLGGYTGTGLAVDSAGSVYVSYGAAVTEFAPNASGQTQAANTVTSMGWTIMTPPSGEDDWFDPSGSIALH